MLRTCDENTPLVTVPQVRALRIELTLKCLAHMFSYFGSQKWPWLEKLVIPAVRHCSSSQRENGRISGRLEEEETGSLKAFHNFQGWDQHFGIDLHPLSHKCTFFKLVLKTWPGWTGQRRGNHFFFPWFLGLSNFSVGPHEWGVRERWDLQSFGIYLKWKDHWATFLYG